MTMEPKQVVAMVLLLVVDVAGLAYTLDLSLCGAEREASTCTHLGRSQVRMLGCCGLDLTPSLQSTIPAAGSSL